MLKSKDNLFKRAALFIIYYAFTLSISLAATHSESTLIKHNNWVNNDWEFTIAPYAWALSMNGRVGIGSRTAHVDQSFKEILQKLNFAGMLWLDLHHERYGAFLNMLYAAMSDNATQGFFSVHDKNKYGLLTGGISYQVYRHLFGSSASGNGGLFIIEPYAGFRYTTNQVELSFHSPAINLITNNNQYWTDPIIGIRFISLFHNGFEANLSSDIGGLNRSTQYSYNAAILLGYQPQRMWKNTKFYLGYRILDQRYRTGNGIRRFNWNMKLTGPLIGVAFTF